MPDQLIRENPTSPLEEASNNKLTRPSSTSTIQSELIPALGERKFRLSYLLPDGYPLFLEDHGFRSQIYNTAHDFSPLRVSMPEGKREFLKAWHAIGFLGGMPALVYSAMKLADLAQNYFAR